MMIPKFVTDKILTKKNLELAFTCVLSAGAAVANWYNQRTAIEAVGKKVGEEVAKQVSEKKPEPVEDSKEEGA